MSKRNNISYTAPEPTFLRKLRGEYGGDKANIQVARPKKARLTTGDEEEDAPVMVDESGHEVKKDEWERMKKAEDVKDDQEKAEEKEDLPDVPREKAQKVAEVGGTTGVVMKKRKVGKVIGNEKQDDDEVRENSKTEKAEAKSGSKDAVKSKAKAKAKKIKLSFDEPE